MAMFMPVVKKNYNIYGDRSKIACAAPDGSDGIHVGRKISQSSGGSGRSRRIRSEGPSLSTSPAAQGENITAAMKIPKGSKPMQMRRARGSAPLLSVNNVPFHRHNSLPGGPNTAPTGNSPAPVSPTHSTGSGSTSSSSENSPGHHRFHIKLLSRLRKSLRLKDPAPAAS